MSSENTRAVQTEQATEAHADAFDLAVKVTNRNQNVSRNASAVHHLVSIMWAHGRENTQNTGSFLNKCGSTVNFVYLLKLTLHYLFNTEL